MKITSRKKIINLKNTIIMGILNATPDSFFDGNKYNKVSKAIDKARKMIYEGAKIIDVGGQSTRPGYKKISSEEEIERVYPIISAIRKRFDVFISLDTFRYEVVKNCSNLIDMINDVHSFSKKESLNLANKFGFPICIVHNKKIKKNSNIFEEVKNFFVEKIFFCKKYGIKKKNIIIDPGFGFKKTLLQNYQILSNLHFLDFFKVPILIGISRKSMVGKIVKKSVENRLFGSLSCAIIASLQNANIIRTHDVKETVESIKIVHTIKKIKEKNAKK
ncbi:dihydropteroate synthase [bacterium endosymbiont of Pedicinus badii]|uniref:dihydropteroate synthase n=1 Tax=bacterium endosymbiont of Pedicinus badii TaxID=1719126 RepID=UPI0009BA5986|nr:dihydropteroate synthase [bacterium endosymbiont of Pedicinus badii]OQM34189.1 hypothetical protein AOQ89_02535 [bacterium endosymbiont of Pedicinus badii]